MLCPLTQRKAFALAFLVIGTGTFIGAIVGALTIARLRAVGLVIVLLFGGAILTGFAYNLLATTGL